MSMADINYMEAYQRGLKKLEFRWRYIDHIINDLKADTAFGQHRELIDLLDYLKKGTNRVKLGVQGTKRSIYYPLEINTLIDAKDARWQNNNSIQSGLFILGSAIAELQETIKDLNDRYALVVMEEEYYGYSNHWHLIDRLIKETE